jgi:hypothetical protein
MWKKIFILTVIAVLGGCATTYHGLTPLPAESSWKTSETRPLFQWEPSKKDGITYDFIIYERVTRKRTPVPGKTIYYKEGLDKPVHKIDTDLVPGKYLWSVRTREGQAVGEWSRYDYDAFYGVMFVWKRNLLFEIAIDNQKQIRKVEVKP